MELLIGEGSNSSDEESDESSEEEDESAEEDSREDESAEEGAYAQMIFLCSFSMSQSLDADPALCNKHSGDGAPANLGQSAPSKWFKP